jgi:hypothetical protein
MSPDITGIQQQQQQTVSADVSVAHVCKLTRVYRTRLLQHGCECEQGSFGSAGAQRCLGRRLKVLERLLCASVEKGLAVVPVSSV